MYKLYANVAGWKKVDISLDEKDIVDTMIKGYEKFKIFDYMIIKRENETDEVYKRTRTEEDFKEYLQDFKERTKPIPLDDMSCVELKRYILNKKGL